MDRTILESFLQQSEEYRILFSQLREGKSVHAYLISGEKGTGKKTLAKLMSAALLCSSAGERPCGTCRNCLLSEKDEHPDLVLIEKGNPIAPGLRKDRSTIPVEDIREMIRICGVRSPDGNMRVVRISDADKMTQQAQNCLLKTLEEPPSDTCIILTTDHPESLLPTVVSRCRTIRTRSWDDSYIQYVLRKTGIPEKRISEVISASEGSVGKALELSSDDSYWELREELLNAFFRTSARSEVLAVSNRWKDRKQEAEMVFSVLETFLRTLYEARFNPAKETDISFFPPQWQLFSGKAPRERFVLLADCIREARHQVQFSTNFQAVFERMIFTFIGEGNAWLQS